MIKITHDVPIKNIANVLAHIEAGGKYFRLRGIRFRLDGIELGTRDYYSNRVLSLYRDSDYKLINPKAHKAELDHAIREARDYGQYLKLDLFMITEESRK